MSRFHAVVLKKCLILFSPTLKHETTMLQCRGHCTPYSPPQFRHFFSTTAAAAWYSPPKSLHQSQIQDSFDPILTTLCEAIKNSPKKPLQSSLKNLLPSLKPQHIINLINLNPQSVSPQSLYSFFTWLSSHSHSSNYRHTLFSYCTMAHFLSSHKMLPYVHNLINTVVSRKGKNSASSVFASILETKGTRRSNFYVIFNSLIIAYLELGLFDDAIQCYKLIKDHQFNVPFEACLRILNHFMKLKSPEVTWDFYKEILECGFPPDLFFFNILMNKLCKAGQIREAQLVFDEIGKRGLRPSIVSFNTLINGYSRLGNLNEGFRLKRVMEEGGILPDVYTYSVLINELCRESELDSANELFGEMCEKGLVPNHVTFTTLINGYCKNGMIGLAMEIYQKMLKQGVEPDLITYNTMVDGLCKIGDLSKARSLVDEMTTKGLKPDKVTYTTLIDGFCKEGNLEEALEIRDGMVKEGIELDDVTYTALITGLCRERLIVDAENILREMLNAGLKPNDAAYTMVMDGFCKIGDVKKGFKLLKEMQSDGHIPGIVTYNVLMNGLCKLGQMKNADMLLHAMLSLGVDPDDITYNILLEGHCKYGNPEEFHKLRSEKGLIFDYGTYSSLIGSVRKTSIRYNR